MHVQINSVQGRWLFAYVCAIDQNAGALTVSVSAPIRSDSNERTQMQLFRLLENCWFLVL